MRIQHNIMAMNAYRNYTNNTSALSKNLEKLSSGYKINRAGDDAAGLAISEKMRAQITGLDKAQDNAKDGISLVQTAEGALTEVHDMLNRMVELADSVRERHLRQRDRPCEPAEGSRTAAGRNRPHRRFRQLQRHQAAGRLHGWRRQCVRRDPGRYQPPWPPLLQAPLLLTLDGAQNAWRYAGIHCGVAGR